MRYVSRNSPSADGRQSLPSAGAAFDARPCGQGLTMLANTHNTATSMVSVRAHRAAPYSLRRHRVGWSAVAMLLRRRTKVCLRGARGVCDDTKKCWECCPRCTAVLVVDALQEPWQPLVGPPCVWSCCHERWSQLVGRRRAQTVSLLPVAVSCRGDVCGQRQGCGMYFSQRGAVYIRKQAGVLGGRVCPYVGALPRGGVTAAQTRAHTKT